MQAFQGQQPAVASKQAKENPRAIWEAVTSVD
jgi:hypothetical protein